MESGATERGEWVGVVGDLRVVEEFGCGGSAEEEVSCGCIIITTINHSDKGF